MECWGWDCLEGLNAPQDSQWLVRRPADQQAIILQRAAAVFLIAPQSDNRPTDATFAAVRVCSRACRRRQATVADLCRGLFYKPLDMMNVTDLPWLQQLYEHGYAVVDDYFPSTLVNEVIGVIGRSVAANFVPACPAPIAPSETTTFSGSSTSFLGSLSSQVAEVQYGISSAVHSLREVFSDFPTAHLISWYTPSSRWRNDRLAFLQPGSFSCDKKKYEMVKYKLHTQASLLRTCLALCSCRQNLSTCRRQWQHIYV